ncbi:Glutamate decarboxylase 1 [Bagarius yarrelli]|uniref:Glutamate decarboxylase 1 n=1 Tax=Bagarius yarrelli TaxID=175774 RepID=A0A556U4T6_BAGYA|nr:Glutamate decarboxylase 1 [Bagarius yarrelli]
MAAPTAPSPSSSSCGGEPNPNTTNLRPPASSSGRVIPADLEAKGYVPFFVSATAGTTVYGAFDPINEIADICEKYNMWLHVDVAPKIKAMMMECGSTMVGYQPQGEKVNFFRMVISNPAATMSDIDFLIDEIERLGQDL